MSDKLLDHILNQNTMLLDLALNGDGGEATQLQAELDAVREQLKTEQAERARAESAHAILTNALDESNEELERFRESQPRMRDILDKRTEVITKREKRIKECEEQIAAQADEIAALRAQPQTVINPNLEDLARFITAAVENFDTNPEKAFKNISRAHIALQGKKPNND